MFPAYSVKARNSSFILETRHSIEHNTPFAAHKANTSRSKIHFTTIWESQS